MRFPLLTFAAATIVFATIWAGTAPNTAAPISAAPAAPPEMYTDCAAVRAAGAAPLRAGLPGYRAALDPNMNGIACESSGSAAFAGPAPGADAPVVLPPHDAGAPPSVDTPPAVIIPVVQPPAAAPPPVMPPAYIPVPTPR